MVGRSKDKNETEPVAQIKFTILKDGTIVTDSDYLPNDVNERAHDAMVSLSSHACFLTAVPKHPLRHEIGRAHV